MALLIVNSKEEMTDTSQQYVLASTGTIWQYQSKTVTKEPKNQIKHSINADGTPYNDGKGWKAGYRLNSAGEEKSLSSYKVTGFMPSKFGDTLRFKEIVGESTSNTNISFFDSSFAILNMLTTAKAYDAFNAGQYVINENLASYGLMKSIENMAYIRLSVRELSDASMLTVNEPLEPTTTTVSDWYDTGVKYQDTSEELAQLQEDVTMLTADINKLKRYMGLHV